MKKCDFCGEKKGIKLIPNPNMDSNDDWLVCEECEIHIDDCHKKAGEVFLKLMIKDLENKKKEGCEEQ